MAKDKKKEAFVSVADKQQFGTWDLKDKKLHDKILAAVMDRHTAVQVTHQKKINEWKNYHLAWEGKIAANSNSKSRVFLPETRNAVEDMVDQMMEAFTSLKKPFKIRGLKKPLPHKTKTAIEQILMHDLKLNLWEEELETALRQGCITGTYAIRCGRWRRQSKSLKKVRIQDFADFGFFKMPLGVRSKVEEYIEFEDVPEFKAIDIRDLYFDPQRITWVIEKQRVDWDYLLAWKRRGLYQISEEAMESQDTTYNDPDLQREVDVKDGNRELISDLDRHAELLVAHHIPIEHKGKRYLVIAEILNRQHVIRCQPTPFEKAPYLIFPHLPRRDTVYGIGIPESIETLQAEMNTRNQITLDANSLGLYAMMLVNMRYIKKPDQLKIRKNGVIELHNLPPEVPAQSVVQFVRPPIEHYNISTDIQAKLKDYIRSTTRLKGVGSGEKVTPNPSATEMVSLVKEALKSLRKLFKRVDRNLMEEWLHRAYIQNVLHRTKPWKIHVETVRANMFGIPEKIDDYIEIKPEDIYSDGIDIEMLGVTHMEDEVVTKQQKLQLFNILANFANAPIRDDEDKPVILHLHKIISDIMIQHGELDPDALWIPAQPTPQGPTSPTGQPGQQQGQRGNPELNPNVPQSNKMEDLIKSTVEIGQQGGEL